MTTTDPLQFINLLEILWFDADALKGLLFKLAFDIVMAATIVLLIYRPANDRSEFAFTYIIFNILIFCLCHMMINVELGLGFAFGLFALFSIMRYRTTTIGIKDMTYLFAVVCIAVINALPSENFSVAEVVAINLFIVGSIFMLEKLLFRNEYDVKKITYEYVDRIKPEKEAELIEDLEARTGRKIVKVQVASMNYLNDSAVLEVHFEKQDETNSRLRYLNEKATQNGITQQNELSDTTHG